MSNDEAKFVLQAYRPSGHDANEPAMAAALAQAKNDPAVGAWFAREQTHAAVMARKLRELAPPSDLRDAILAGARATERAAPRGSRRGFPVWFGVAAGVAAVIAITIGVWPRNAGAADEMTAFALHDVQYGRHGSHGDEAHALQVKLANPDTRLAPGIPVDLATLEKTGCRTLRVAGHDVIEVCFKRGEAEFHCYIGHARDFPSASGGEAMTFVQRAGLTAASWSRGTEHFVVVTEAGLDAVKRLL
jgi:hypothetical protein